MLPWWTCVMQGPVFCFYEIMWLRGPQGWRSGEPVQLMMPRVQSGGGKWAGVIILSMNMMRESRLAGLKSCNPPDNDPRECFSLGLHPTPPLSDQPLLLLEAQSSLVCFIFNMAAGFLDFQIIMRIVFRLCQWRCDFTLPGSLSER